MPANLSCDSAQRTSRGRVSKDTKQTEESWRQVWPKAVSGGRGGWVKVKKQHNKLSAISHTQSVSKAIEGKRKQGHLVATARRSMGPGGNEEGLRKPLSHGVKRHLLKMFNLWDCCKCPRKATSPDKPTRWSRD
ncbi:hypothetical protein NDU88_003879 [Pleurodeles waltl]|uniref:Uncharacterized protein n=1 Tax=Pleurodeles waltl TaxID=8319 RepID=A0AAV7M5B8_PLEWA|nr:hypothetical protein NDU88_003879 [Pleurodeles waltl]